MQAPVIMQCPISDYFVKITRDDMKRLEIRDHPVDMYLNDALMMAGLG